MANQIKTRSLYNKKTDSLNTAFYELKGGRWHKLPENKKREYLKKNYSKLNINELAQQDRNYVKQIEGGKKRAAQSVRIDGKYVSKSFLENDKAPARWVQLAHDRGFGGDVNKLFKNDPDLYAQAVKYYKSPDGMPFEFYSDNILHYVDTWGGPIYINGEKVSKINALSKIDDTDKEIKRKFGSFTNQYEVNMKKGFTELHIKLPTLSQIEQSENPDDFNEDETGVTVIASDTEENKLRREEKKLDLKEERTGKVNTFKYKYFAKEPIKKINKDAKKKTAAKTKKTAAKPEKGVKKYRSIYGYINARSIIEAKHIAKLTIGPNSILIRVIRVNK